VGATLLGEPLDYRPPVGLASAHAQSLLAGSPLRRAAVRLRAARLYKLSLPRLLACGDGVRLLGLFTPQQNDARGLVILLHGWEGCAESPYILSSAATLHSAGYEIFRLNFRDHGNTHHLNEGLFHSCRLEEVVDAVKCIEAAFPSRPLFLVGYSLGGNFALRVAARATQSRIKLVKTIAVSPVLEPKSTMAALEEGFWLYRYHFLRRWRSSLARKAAIFPGLYDFGDLRRFRTLTETTDFFVSRYTHFRSLDEYLSGYAVTGGALATLDAPAKIIVAADDPLVPCADLSRVAAGGKLEVALFKSGGHCAFLGDYALRSRLDAWVVESLSEERPP
jgi:predicted alpha/beta-fold hydrolase